MAEQQIEPAALAAAGLLAASALGTQAGQAGTGAWQDQARLAELVQRAITDSGAAAVLDDATGRPQDPAAVGALAQALAAVAAQDRGFRDVLARVVGQAVHDSPMRSVATTIAGHAQVGKLVTIGHAGSVHVHLPPPPPQTPLDRLHRGAVSTPLVANLPPRNPVFTGRDQLVGQLHSCLQPGEAAAVVQVQAQALHGLGGVGKTQLALEYAHRHAGDYELVWWVSAEQPAAIGGQLAALARRLGIAEATNQAETIAMLYDELRGRDRWLLVFDNAEDPAGLRPWWPPASGRVLVTSRNPAWGGLATTVPLDVLSRSEAVAFLRRRIGRDDPGFDQLAEALGDLPLALEQAAAYLDETATTPGAYLGLLATSARELFALGRPATTEQTIATTWTVSLQRLREQAPAAEDLLVLCAFLAPDDIPRDLPGRHAEVLPARLAATVQDTLAYQQVIGALRRYSLISTSQDGGALSVHRLVQAVTRQQLDEEQQRRWAAIALRMVRAGFPADHTNPAAWPEYGRLLPHILVVTEHASRLEVEPDGIGWSLNEAGLYLSQRADNARARILLERALSIYETHRSADHPDVAQSLNNLANHLRAQGELDRARALHERALSIRVTQLGADHPHTASSLNNLANVLADQGDLAGARALHERVLSIREASLGADDPDVAASLNNLANIHYLQGDYQRARSLFERALAIREGRLGPDHPDTAASLNNLANIHYLQGDLDGAGALFERALAIYERRLGDDHPHVAASLSNLASVLAEQGDQDGARTRYERAVAIYEARLGHNHPQTATALNNLALVVSAQGDLDHARTLHEQALSIREARLGADHPDTAASLNNLANVVRAQGDPDRARTLLERALAVYEARLGPDHLRTADSLNDLANVLTDQRDLDGAYTLYERALAIKEARLGPDHPHTADALYNLAAVLVDQGHPDRARPLLERALAIYEARLGPDHPGTQRTQQALAMVMAQDGQQ